MRKEIATHKKYNTPKLTVYGSITELTQANNLGNGDGIPGTDSGTT